MLPNLFPESHTEMTTLPSPASMGAPSRFVKWRPSQADAWERYTESDKRFNCSVQPTGSGKSLYVYMCGLYTEVPAGRRPRVLILTANKALQDQYIRDFDLFDIRGQNNYECVAVQRGGILQHYGERRRTMVDRAPCHAGVHCRLKNMGGCAYYDSVEQARRADFVITNYSYWMALGKLRRRSKGEDPLGQFDLLVLDEAHAADGEVCKALRIELATSEVRSVLSLRPPDVDASVDTWRAWGQLAFVKCGSIMDLFLGEIRRDPESVDSSLVAELQTLRNLSAVLDQISALAGDWVIGTSRNGSTITFDPVWPAPYCEELLYRGINKILFVSATIRPKTLEILGVPVDDSDFAEYPSTFPVARRPIYIVPCAPRIDKNLKKDSPEESLWAARQAQIIEARVDRKGIVHSVSYERAYRLKQILQVALGKNPSSRGTVAAALRTHFLRTHARDETREAIQNFKKARQPALLISPSITTGEDFPMSECEYIIVAKLPFIDMRDPVMRRREKSDPEYGGYQMMQTLIQSLGRGMRGSEDQCEGFIVDDHARWVFSRSAKRNLRKFAPKWFLDAVQWPTSIPLPPPKLRG